MCTHPNVGAVLLVSLGCEEFRRGELARSGAVERQATAELLVIQDSGGTRASVEQGRDWVRAMRSSGALPRRQRAARYA